MDEIRPERFTWQEGDIEILDPPEVSVNAQEIKRRYIESGAGWAASQRSVDFKAIEKTLDANERSFIDEGKKDLQAVLSILKNTVKAGQPALVMTISIRGMAPFKESLRLMMLGALLDGQKDLAAEVGVTKKFQSLPRVKPRDAIAFMKRKAIVLAAGVEDEILKDVRRILIAGLETGMSTADIVQALGVSFEKWVGSDVTRDGKPVPAARLEAIARTESTSGYNQGRVVAARDPELKGLIQGMRWDSILDSRSSEVCQFMDQKIIPMDSEDLDALTPPAHVNCRSILTPITISRQVDESEFITPSEVGQAKELAGSGFAGGGSF